jgi:hypothetical protein
MGLKAEGLQGVGKKESPGLEGFRENVSELQILGASRATSIPRLFGQYSVQSLYCSRLLIVAISVSSEDLAHIMTMANEEKQLSRIHFLFLSVCNHEIILKTLLANGFGNTVKYG